MRSFRIYLHGSTHEWKIAGWLLPGAFPAFRENPTSLFRIRSVRSISEWISIIDSINELIVDIWNRHVLFAETKDGKFDNDEDYSASISAIMLRRASTKRRGSRARRSSSPYSLDPFNPETKRRSSVYTNSSGESVENYRYLIFSNIYFAPPWGHRLGNIFAEL